MPPGPKSPRTHFDHQTEGEFMSTSSRNLWWSTLACTVLVAACGDDDPAGPSLSPPNGLTATATSTTSVHLTWNAVTGAGSYVIERAEGPGAFAEAGTSATTSFDDDGLTEGATYRYRVAARAGSSTSDFSNEASATPGSQIEVTADITASTTWTKDKVYRLKGFIHVQDGATLTIEAGTRIEGDYNTLGASLFIMRGARIEANGTADEPIVFTSSRAPGQREAGDWGGLILIGNGVINRASPVNLEGTGTDANNPLINYAGGTDNDDGSGTLRYVRVEFAGFAPQENAELNSFTFAAVGGGTTLEYLQSLNGLDDSFEFFGGAADAKYLVSYNAGDDHFDMSEGYVGRIQFAIAYQTRTVIPRQGAPGNISSDPQGIENDGCAGANCTSGENSTPLTIPVVANATLIGPPATVTNSSGNIGMMLRRGTGGYYVNSVVARWSRAAVSLRDQSTLDRLGSDLAVENLLLTEAPVLFQPQTGATIQGSVDEEDNALQFESATTAESIFEAVPATEPANGAVLDFTPAAGSPATTGGLETFAGDLASRAGTFVTPTAYRGAAAPGGPKWWQGWTTFAVN
jgi:hypothetical protein